MFTNTIYHLSDASELMSMLSAGNNRRTQHPTDANAQSSRSHAVFAVNLTVKQGIDINESLSHIYLNTFFENRFGQGENIHRRFHCYVIHCFSVKTSVNSPSMWGNWKAWSISAPTTKELGEFIGRNGIEATDMMNFYS